MKCFFLRRGVLLSVVGLMLTASGCSVKVNDPDTWGNLIREPVGFVYRSVTDGEVEDVTFSGKPVVKTTEAIPCFSSMDGIELNYVFDIFSEKTFTEKVTWRRGSYSVVTERDIKARERIKVSFPKQQVMDDLGENWPGEWIVQLSVKGVQRKAYSFRLVSKKSYERLMQQAGVFKNPDELELKKKIETRARECWPECIVEL